MGEIDARIRGGCMHPERMPDGTIARRTARCERLRNGRDRARGRTVDWRSRMSVPTSTRDVPVRSTYEDDDRGYGWVLFAGVMLLTVGVLNMIDGIAAIGNANFFNNNTHYVFANLNTWGWIVLILGVAQLLIGLGVFAKNQFSRWTGVFVLSLNAVAQLLFIPAYPFWSLAIFSIDILAIYGLTAYGSRIARA
jgi:hypothetical protein